MMSTNRFILLVALLFCIGFYSSDAFCQETYRIENNRVLLYKIINWWYDCLPDECDLICGKTVECINQGDAEILYNASDRTLKIRIRDGFAGLLSVLNGCKDCGGPPSLKCGQINKAFLGNGRAAGVTTDFYGLREFRFTHIGKKQAKLLTVIKEDIIFYLKGIAGGLVDGRIALYPDGHFQKACPENSKYSKTAFPMILKILNGKTDEVIATYAPVWTND